MQIKFTHEQMTVFSEFGRFQTEPCITINDENGGNVANIKLKPLNTFAKRFTTLVTDELCSDELDDIQVDGVEYFSCTERLIIELKVTEADSEYYNLTLTGQRTATY